jgi:DNA topoisomerase-2
MSKSSNKEMAKKPTKTVEELYTGKTLHEHILSAPDTYIGTSIVDDVTMFIYNEEKKKIEENVINYVAGLFKIFDEILVNARDQTVRDNTCKHIKIDIDKKSGQISVWNDGVGIPIAIHKKYNVYAPEVIFSNLLTSQNYEVKGKQVGGKNGYGAKLANIYSKMFKITLIGYDRIDDIKNAKKIKYEQVCRDNMFKIEEPIVDKKIDQSSKTFTQITFIPDYEKFGMSGLSDDMYSLMMKRCYDIAACTSKSVVITINGTDVKCRDFKDYIKLYYPDDKKKDNEDDDANDNDVDTDEDKKPKKKDNKPKITHAKINDRWEIGIGFNKDVGDRDISFVNGISTFRGGTHVNHVVNTIVTKVTAFIKKKKEHSALKILPITIRQYLTFFVNCIIEDPSFGSQTKEFMNSKISNWCTCGNNCPDVKCDIGDEFIEELCKNGLMEEVVEASKFKEARELAKTDGKKVSKLRTIEKLIDAKLAGGRRSAEASLMITEGDSAKAFALSGMSVVGNEKFGVFPVQGKCQNVRNASPKKVNANKEYTNLKAILGLKTGAVYKDVSKLRYGAIIIMTDQDPDGSHIKGLIINMFERFWPELLQIDGFIKCYNTPIVKAWKKSDREKKNVKEFYSTNEYTKWVQTVLKDDTKGWEHKYYKGLGTSTDKEARESFRNYDNNLMPFVWEYDDNNDESSTEVVKPKKNIIKKSNDLEEKEEEENDIQNDEEIYDHTRSKSHQAIVKAFDKKRANDRKEWIMKFNRENMLEYKPGMSITYSEFIDKELIIFSRADNDRSIPSMMDGLKPSLRMIMFCMFKRGRNAKEVKVAQLSGYVSENTDYHHGEASLQGAIIGLAQNFPGSNNINLLRPLGNFGYRRQGGKDHASPRYIFTQLDKITSYIYREEDEEILKYNYDDGKKVEPNTFAPIIPMVLINGTEGIGTGFSTKIPPHNPKDIVENIKRIMQGKEVIEMKPWFNGFKGTVEKNLKKENKYIIKGKYSLDGNKVIIEDIPIVNGWIEDYERKIEAKVSVTKEDSMKIEDFEKNPSNNNINMVLIFKGNELQKMFKDNSLEKFLLMSQSLSVTNLHLYNKNGKLVKYNSIQEILHDYYAYRLEMYGIRKDYYLKKLENDLNIAKYKVKFIKENNAKTIVLANKDIASVIKQLKDKGYPMLSKDHRSNETVDENGDIDETEDKGTKRSYRYLLDMAMKSMTKERIQELEKTMEQCQALYDEYASLTPKDLWNKELDEFLVAYNDWIDRWNIENSTQGDKSDKQKKTVKKKTVKKDN